MKIVICIAFILLPIFSYSMADVQDDSRVWISKKLLWTFLPPSDFRKLGDRYDMNGAQIHVMHPETGMTVMQTPRYQFLCDMHAMLPVDVFDYIVKLANQRSKELDAIRKFYVHSYRLQTIFKKESFIESESYSGRTLYTMPEIINGNVLRFRGLDCNGYFRSLQIIPSDRSIWKYDIPHRRIGLQLKSSLYDYKLGFNAKSRRDDDRYTYKFYTKSYSQELRQLFFESKFGFVTQDKQKNVHVFCTSLVLDRIDAFASCMSRLSVYERAIAYDLLRYNAQPDEDYDTCGDDNAEDTSAVPQEPNITPTGHQFLSIRESCIIS